MKKMFLISLVCLCVCCGESPKKNVASAKKNIAPSEDTIASQKNYINFESSEELLKKINKSKNLFSKERDIGVNYKGWTSSYTDSVQLIKKRIGTKYNIYLYTYQYTPPEYAAFHTEYLEINNLKISIDSLLRKGHNDVIEKNPYFYFHTVSYLHFGKNDYVLIELGNRNFNMNGDIFSYLLIKMHKSQLISTWLFYNGYQDEKVFADFDNDGELDYLDWGTRKNEISLYSLKKDSLIKNKEKFIFVVPSKEFIKFEETYHESNDWYYIVDKSKSNWFFKF
ncbi:hypothetical protein ACFFLS_10090 [Flavobacterium procerum]|uniref:Lipoprotein n=1 Tax=Flavobacterium procerum TaxID=1455569 RepID=A0ABV6BPK7_9FLAO